MDALIIIDIQNDYFPGGPMALTGADEAGANAARLLARLVAPNLERAREEATGHVR